jgi:MFS superfamily sulfate permease-like transporter
VLLFLTGPLQYLPHCVLGALVLLVAIRLIDLKGLREISLESPGEYALALTTAVVVVVVGVEQGIVLAMVMSLFRIVHHSYHPHSGVMVRNETGTWIVIPAAPGAVTKPGLVLYRFGAALFYANASRFAEEISTIVGPAPSSVRWVIIDAEAITHVDYTAARILQELKRDLVTAGVELAFARVPWECRADLDRHHLLEIIGTNRIYNHLHSAIEAFNALE